MIPTGGVTLAVRLLAQTILHAPVGTAIVGAAETGNNGVRTTIITGVFAILVALIGAAGLLLRGRNPDLSELLEVHERLAVIETNQADMRADLRALMRRLDK